MKKLGRLLAVCALLGLLLTGCNMPLEENRQVEDLLRAPQLAGDYGALQSALNDWLGESAQLKYPLQGELLSPFVLQDLDGDGVQDAAVFYTTAQSTNVCIAILQKDAEGNWEVRQNLEGLADTVDTVRLARLQAGGSTQLVVGYVASRGDNYLAVYSYEDGELSAILEQSYEQYLVEDITGGGNQDLILMSTLEDGGVQIELLTVDRDGSFRQVAVMGLSADKFSGCASVAAGVGADGKRYLVLDGWTGISGNNLATVLLHFDEESQQMIPADQISTQELYNESLRNVSTLVSRDLDGDGTVEIPTQPDEAGLLNMSQSRRMDFIVWMDYTSPDPKKSFGLLDEETNCYIELPMEWEGNLMLTDSTEVEGAVELRTVDENKLVLTVRLASNSADAAGWTRLGMVASRQMQAKFGPNVTRPKPDRFCPLSQRESPWQKEQHCAERKRRNQTEICQQNGGYDGKSTCCRGRSQHPRDDRAEPAAGRNGSSRGRQRRSGTSSAGTAARLRRGHPGCDAAGDEWLLALRDHPPHRSEDRHYHSERQGAGAG